MNTDVHFISMSLKSNVQKVQSRPKSWIFVQHQIVLLKSTSKNSSQILSINHNKHLSFFVFKTKRELKCQNEVFFNIIRIVCFDYWEFLTNFLTYFLMTLFDAVQKLGFWSCFESKKFLFWSLRFSDKLFEGINDYWFLTL